MSVKLVNSLEKILNNLDYKLLNGKIDNTNICKVVYNSRDVKKDDLFICLNGSRFDSHTKISDVINSGAKVIVVEKGNKNLRGIDFKDTIVIEVENTRLALSIISKNCILLLQNLVVNYL